ncbi:hypothetical protein [Ciceribacter sp. T2.26MG-112.2]|uniref:hypothetical protein n=1 Tax=Ciceribacter sp. T2.26MG-112.2 TaxID=3137154 RepID=UPI0012B687D2|nr:hypothetical protein [Ciceribacter naphthalenivorans]
MTAPLTGKSPYEAALTELAAFKFALIETAAADPKLHGSPSLAVLVTYLKFMTIDRQTLKPTLVYASNNTLMAHAAIRSKTTAAKARKLLVNSGYLKPVKSKTSDGCEKFRIENTRADHVRAHIHEALAFHAEQDVFRKAEERRRKAVNERGVPNINTPSDAEGANVCDDRVPNFDTNYLRGNLKGYILGRESSYQDLADSEPQEPNSYISAQSGDELNEPLPIPENDAEAESMVAMICEGASVHPAMKVRIKAMLTDGILTPRMIDGMLSNLRKETAA